MSSRWLIERGVRIVPLYHGDVQLWDSHNEIAKNHRSLANEFDGPIAALLTDLKQRGLFEETLVICGGEFSRTPTVELMRKKGTQLILELHFGIELRLLCFPSWHTFDKESGLIRPLTHDEWRAR